MPSTLQKIALGAALAGTALAGKPKACQVGANTPLSCHNSTAVKDTCCFNAPGGQLLQTQFWDLGDGPSDSWTIHGLWPDNCDGTYEANCDPDREYDNIADIVGKADPDLLDFMNKYWKDNSGDDESLWKHEWDKHGTCISTMDPDCYTDYQEAEEAVDFFSKTVELFKTLNSYEFLTKAGIKPSNSETYTQKDVLAALKAGHGATPAISCEGDQLDEIWYFYNVKGSIQTGKFVPSDPDGAKSNCPEDGIKWPPKTGGGGGGNTTTTATPQPTSTGKPHHGRRRRNSGPFQPRWV